MKQVWINPKGNRNKVVILTDEAILLSNPEQAQLQEFKQAAQAGQLRTSLLAQDMQVIPLVSILRLQSNRERSHIQFIHGFGGKPSQSLAQFDELGTRDNAFESLRQALGSGFSVALRETGKLKSAWQPLAKAGMVATLAFFLRASVVHAGAGESDVAMQKGLLIFGPNAITLVAICMVAYYLREFYGRTQHSIPLLELVRD